MYSFSGWFRRILIAALLLGTTACVTVPAQQMSDARQAMQAAEEAGAPERAPDEYIKAHQLLEEADQLLKQGDYGKAKKIALAAKEAALNAREKAMQGSFGR